jgi:DNA invertase Pin-like site-specific DNA recombinase
MQKLAKERGFKIVKVFSEAKSAKAPGQRRVFTQMLADIRKGEADGILCWQLNRLFRNPVDSGDVQWLLQEGKIKSIRTHEREYLPEDNAVIFSVESSVANQFILDLKKNTKRGLYAKFERGEFPGLAPLGYINKTLTDANGVDRQTIVPDPNVYPLVRKMFDLLLSGAYNPLEIHQIALTEWGLASVRGKRRKGLPISKSSIYRILNSKFYAGIIEYAGMERRGVHQAMLTLDEFDRVQALLGSKGKPRKQEHEFPFTGLMQCATCGCAITAETKTKYIKSTKQVKYFTYYRCSRRHNTKDFKCTEPTITAPKLIEQFQTIAGTIALPKEIIDWAIDVIDSNETVVQQEQAHLQSSRSKDIQSKEKQIDKLIEMCSNDLLTVEEFKSKKLKLVQEIQQLKQFNEQQIETSKRLELIKDAFVFAVNVPSLLNSSDMKVQRLAAKKLCSSYSLQNAELQYELQPWYKSFQNYHSEIMERLEPNEMLSNKEKSEAFTSLIPVLGD